MKLSLLATIPGVPLIDVAGGYTGPYSGPIPDLPFYPEIDCDFLVSPHDLWDIRNNVDYIRYLVGKSRERKVIIFNRGDFPGEIKNPQFIFIQNSIEVGGPTHNRVIVPYNVQSRDYFQSRVWESSPTLCFVGYVPKVSIGRLSRSFFPQFKPIRKNSAVVRRLVLGQVERNFQNKIIVKNNFYGGAAKRGIESATNHRERYLEVLQMSDISLCPRGDANASQRFYETLAAGRIPLVPNTGCSIPVVSGNGRMHTITVKPSSLDLVRRVETFWLNLDKVRYQKMQFDNFQFFENFMRYDIYMKHLFSADKDQLIDQVLR